MPNLSKTRVLSALQCPKRLFLETHQPDLAEVPVSVQSRLATGHQVGAVARSLYAAPGSVLIEHGPGMQSAALERTAGLIAEGHRAPIFEATFRREDVLIRVDILLPDEDGWRIVEVKASTKPKDEHLPDCAVQAWVCAGQGLRVTATALAHVNSQFVYAGDGIYRGLLTEVDVSDAVTKLTNAVPDWVARARDAVSEAMPEIPIGAHCFKPHGCPFQKHCWPTEVRYPVKGLGGLKAKHAELVLDGYKDIRDVPADRLTAATQRRIREVTISGAPEILAGAKSELESLPYPRYYLDFETISPAIPIWPGTRPYEQIPVQWSIHKETESGVVEHDEFLDVSGEPPMRSLAESLIEGLGDAGPILMYTPFEKRLVRSLAESFPDLATSLKAVAGRLVDLQPIVKTNYYHPDMQGSWSIKSVLPTIAPDMRYDELEEIQEGTAASDAFIEAIAPETGVERRQFLEQRLREYCKFDTEAMVRIARFFQG